jgi:hypothetical protein
LPARRLADDAVHGVDVIDPGADAEGLATGYPSGRVPEPAPLSIQRKTPVNKLLSTLILGAFVVVQAPAFAQATATKSTKPADSSASMAKASAAPASAASGATTGAKKKEKKGGC